MVLLIQLLLVPLLELKILSVHEPTSSVPGRFLFLEISAGSDILMQTMMAPGKFSAIAFQLSPWKMDH